MRNTFLATVFGASVLFVGATQTVAATLDFDAIVSAGIYQGIVSKGQLTYDDLQLDIDGSGTLSSGQGLTSLTFSLDGTVFVDATNDIDFPSQPRATFVNGLLTFLDYTIEDGVNGVNLAQFGVESVYLTKDFGTAPDGTLTIGVDVTYTPVIAPVPLPAGGAMLVAGLGLMAMVRRRKAA